MQAEAGAEAMGEGEGEARWHPGKEVAEAEARLEGDQRGLWGGWVASGGALLWRPRSG